MNARELARLIRLGQTPVITFGPRIEEQECYPDEGMRGRLIRTKEMGDGMVEFEVALADFESFNLPLEKPAYYDKAGKPTLTATESGSKVATDTFYVELNDDIQGLLAITSSPKIDLYQRYLDANSGQTYTDWLEDQLLGIQN